MKMLYQVKEHIKIVMYWIYFWVIGSLPLKYSNIGFAASAEQEVIIQGEESKNGAE